MTIIALLNHKNKSVWLPIITIWILYLPVYKAHHTFCEIVGAIGLQTDVHF